MFGKREDKQRKQDSMLVYRSGEKLQIGHRSKDVAAGMISALCREWRLQCSSNVPQASPDHHGQHFIFTIFFIPYLLYLHLALITCKHQLVYTGCGSITSRVLRKQHGRHCEVGTSNTSVQHVAEQPLPLAGHVHDLSECANDLLRACSNICVQACRHGGIWMQACTNPTAVVCTACPTPSSVCTPSLCRALRYMHANGAGYVL